MLRPRAYMALVRTSLGALPPASVCSPVVGQIQQAINQAKAAGKITAGPLVVDGKAGNNTRRALTAILPGWEIQPPETILAVLRDEYAAYGAGFTCPTKKPWQPGTADRPTPDKAGIPPTTIGLIAGAGVLAFLTVLAIKKKRRDAMLATTTV